MMQGGNNKQQMAAMQKRMQAMGGPGRGQMPGGMGDMGKMMQMLQGMGMPGGAGGGAGVGGMPNIGGMDFNALMQQRGGLGGGGSAPGRGRGR